VREGLFVGWSRSEIAGSEVKTGLPTEVFDCVVYKRDWLVEITLAGLKSMKPCHLDSHFLTVDNGWRRGEIKNVLLMNHWTSSSKRCTSTWEGDETTSREGSS